MSSSAMERRPKDHVATTECKEFFRRMASGVAVVTSRSVDGPVGLTASSVTCLSVDPPLLLVCVARGSETLAAIESKREFVVHLLRGDQEWLSAVFSHGSSRDKFTRASHLEVRDMPRLTDCLAWALCSLAQLHVAGDHTIVIGAITRTTSGAGEPLLWHHSSYRRLATDSERGCRPVQREGL